MAKRDDRNGPKRGRNEYLVTPEDFVRAWQKSKSADDAARTLKMPKPIVLARASKYRKKGVKLKNMPRQPKGGGLDVKELNALIQEIDKSI